MAQAAPPKPQNNRLLRALPKGVRERIFPKLELVSMPFGKALYESGEQLRHAYFPTDSIISLHFLTDSGASAEISVVGCEGMVGVALLLGGEWMPGRAMVLSEGHAYRLPKQETKREFDLHGEWKDLVLRYAQVRITQAGQAVACNRHHTIEQQLCRWLLTQLDRRSGNDLVVTQETIANMLGVRREGITESACRLQRLGVIKYRRGHITVLDRPAMEKLSCECYTVVKEETDRLLPYETGSC